VIQSIVSARQYYIYQAVFCQGLKNQRLSNEINASRIIKKEIPPVGIDGIPLLHEFEFEILLD